MKENTLEDSIPENSPSSLGDLELNREPVLMTKTKIACRVHEMVDERLFGKKSWPVDTDSTGGVRATWLELGLIENVAGKDQTFRNTPLGNELNIDLMDAFMGFWDPFDLLEVLERRGLIHKKDAKHLRRVLNRGAGWDRIFKAYVLHAYYLHYNPTQSIN